jgi:hypothetical protein
VLYALAAGLPAFRTADDPANDCASRLIDRPAEEVAAMFFTLWFNALHDVRSIGQKTTSLQGPLKRIGKCIVLAGIAAVLCYSQTYLHLFQAQQIVLAIVGSMLAVGGFVLGVYHGLLPWIKHPVMETVLVWGCCVARESLDEDDYLS